MKFDYTLTAISSLLAQIPGINLFRWIGHFNTILDVLLLLLLLVLFRGEYKVNRIDVVKTVTVDCSKWSSVDMNLRKVIVSFMSLLA